MKFLSGNQLELTAGTGDAFPLNYRAEYDWRGNMLEFVIFADEIEPAITTDYLDFTSNTLLSIYGFDPELAERTLLPKDYRCYVRRSLLRCFNDLDYAVRLP